MFRSILVAGGLLALLMAVPASALERVASLDDATLAAEFSAAMNGQAVEGVGPCLFPHAMTLQSRGLPVVAMAREATADVLYTYDTPEGHFEVDYYRTGIAAVDTTDTDEDGVPDYVERVAEAFEESYRVEVTQLGFPFETGGRYKVRCANLGPGFYGVTLPNDVAYGRSTISINAAFESWLLSPPYDNLVNDDPEGVVAGAIRVTAAHEFRHALQLYRRWLVADEYLGWFEVDAVWMEEIVYDDVNDYYNYLDDTSSPFNRPRTSLITSPSYDDGTWQMFLQQRHGIDYLQRLDARRANFAAEPFPQSFRGIAADLEIDWIELWREYSVFNYLTGDRAVEGLGFEEAARYPTSTTDTLDTLDSPTPIDDSLARWANVFFEFDNRARAVRGELSIDFAVPAVAGWTLSVVLQNAETTQVVPFVHTSAEQTFVVEGYDLSEFDRVALVVGNSTTGTAGILDDFSVSFAVDPEVIGPKSSFSAFKSRF